MVGKQQQFRASKRAACLRGQQLQMLTEVRGK